MLQTGARCSSAMMPGSTCATACVRPDSPRWSSWACSSWKPGLRPCGSTRSTPPPPLHLKLMWGWAAKLNSSMFKLSSSILITTHLKLLVYLPGPTTPNPFLPLSLKLLWAGLQSSRAPYSSLAAPYSPPPTSDSLWIYQVPPPPPPPAPPPPSFQIHVGCAAKLNSSIFKPGIASSCQSSIAKSSKRQALIVCGVVQVSHQLGRPLNRKFKSPRKIEFREQGWGLNIAPPPEPRPPRVSFWFQVQKLK